MKNSLFYITLIIFLSIFHSYGQSNQDKAKAYYQEAEKAFNNKEFNKALAYCQQIIDELQTSNARVELLKLKSYYELEQMDRSRKSLRDFLDLPSEENTRKEALSYLIKIENKEKEIQQKREAEQRKAEEQRIAREKKLAEEKAKREKEESEAYQDAKTGDISSIRYFLKTYPEHIGNQEIQDLLVVREEQIYVNAIQSDKIEDYQEYNHQFKNGKYRSEITGLLESAYEKVAYEQVSQKHTVEEAENYLNKYPNGFFKNEVLEILESAIAVEGEQVFTNNEYQEAEKLYSKYVSYFPSGKQIHIVQRNLKEAQKQIEKQERIDNRTYKIHWIFTYHEDKSYGLDIGRLNPSDALSLYFRFNFNMDFWELEFTPEEVIETVDSYREPLKPAFFTSSLGLAKKITYPLWFYAGAGVRMQQFYGKESNVTIKVKEHKTWVFFPEVGLKAIVGKVPVVKAGIQYIDGKVGYQAGLGFCF